MSSTAAFIAPIVEPHEVAKAIIAALETDQSREIFLPYVGGWLWALRGLPSWAKDFTSWVRTCCLFHFMVLLNVRTDLGPGDQSYRVRMTR